MPRRPGLRVRQGLLRVASALAALTALAAAAQSPPAVISLDTSLSASDGSTRASGDGAGEGGVVASLRPGIFWQHQGVGLSMDLRAAVTLLQHLDQGQEASLLPDLRAKLAATLLDQWLFLDGEASLQQTEADPYGTREHDSAGANRRTEGSYRLSPYLAHQLTPDTALYGRLEATLETQASGAGAGAGRGRALTQRGDLRVERLPLPLGGALQWSGLHTESRDAPDSALTLQTLRAIASASPAADLVLGLVAGQDRSRYLGHEHQDGLAGAELRWDPSPRSALALRLEHRFFGLGGQATLQHRMPLMALGLSFSREPMLASRSLGVPGLGDDLRAVLDAMLATRWPDAGERSAQIEQLIASRGLATRSAGPSDSIADYAQLQSLLRAYWTLLGARHVLSVTLYAQSLQQLRRGEASASGEITSDNRQYGGLVELNRQLSPLLAADLSVRWSHIRGLADRAGDSSAEQVYRVALQRRLTPRSSVSFGLQHTRFRSNAQAQEDERSTLVFIGLSHFF